MKIRTARSVVPRTVVIIVAFAAISVFITPSAWAAVPVVMSFSPRSGPVGTSVTITGQNFTGTTEVDFTSAASATFSFVSDTEITATVPLGSTTGPISVTGPDGTGTSATNFTVKAKVIGTSLSENEPAASDSYLAWSQNSAAHPNHFDAYAEPWGNPKVKVNALHTSGEMGGIDGTTLVYQQYSNAQHVSDIKLFDLDTHVRSNPPAGVNTKHWEDWPSISGHWLLFGRTLASDLESGKKRVILFNTTTGRSRTLAATSTSKPFLIPDQVSGDFAVWERYNGSACDVFRYRISSKKTIRIPNPNSKCQYASSVTTDGTVYFMRSPSGLQCGSASLRTYPSANPTLVSLPKGKDVFDTYAVTDENGDTTVFYDQGSCATGNQDILEVTISP